MQKISQIYPLLLPLSDKGSKPETLLPGQPEGSFGGQNCGIGLAGLSRFGSDLSGAELVFQDAEMAA